ncbi:MAG: polyprenyl synthetase family protein [Candidatus Sericytochromatia bacterium]|nr:polyprenyl synthetase family protein [Candidatus Sericytochromatia bacterium]
MTTSFETLYQNLQAAVDDELQTLLCHHQPRLLWESMAYSVLGGGKRLRPLLCLLACEAVSGKWQPALPAAQAVELIHAYSLIHDDLPALDNDDWRRGKPANHKEYGEDIAILAGDALQTLAFQLLSDPAIRRPDVQVRWVAELAGAAGPMGMCAGQVLDLHAADSVWKEAEILDVYRRKTGALIRAAVRMGALAGGAGPEQLQALTGYAEDLGLAFQIVDDLLDLTGSFEALGKTPGKDLMQDKKTYPALLGQAEARQKVESCLLRARDVLFSVPLLQTGHLLQIAEKLVHRET